MGEDVDNQCFLEVGHLMTETQRHTKRKVRSVSLEPTDLASLIVMRALNITRTQSTNLSNDEL